MKGPYCTFHRVVQLSPHTVCNRFYAQGGPTGGQGTLSPTRGICSMDDVDILVQLGEAVLWSGE